VKDQPDDFILKKRDAPQAFLKHVGRAFSFCPDCFDAVLFFKLYLYYFYSVASSETSGDSSAPSSEESEGDSDSAGVSSTADSDTSGEALTSAEAEGATLSEISGDSLGVSETAAGADSTGDSLVCASVLLHPRNARHDIATTAAKTMANFFFI
jgi:hypothetical protein